MVEGPLYRQRAEQVGLPELCAAVETVIAVVPGDKLLLAPSPACHIPVYQLAGMQRLAVGTQVGNQADREDALC